MSLVLLQDVKCDGKLYKKGADWDGPSKYTADFQAKEYLCPKVQLKEFAEKKGYNSLEARSFRAQKKAMLAPPKAAKKKAAPKAPDKKK